MDHKQYHVFVKVDTDAIAKNGKLPKSPETKYNPAITVLVKDEFGRIVDDIRAHHVDIEGKVWVIQDDLYPGAVGPDGRAARVWLAVQGKLEATTYEADRSISRKLVSS